MTDQGKEAAARFDRKFMIVLVPALIFLIVSLYVRITSGTDPLWTELATPLFFGLIGVRLIMRPAPPESRKALAWVGYLLFVLSVILLALAISNSQGAN